VNLTDKIAQAIDANNEQEKAIPVGKGPIVHVARTYFSPTDSYEDEIGPDSPLEHFHPGSLRGMWAVAEQQQASVPVTALTSSGNTKNAGLAAIQGGIAQNPVAPPTVWAAVPSLITNIAASGPVMVTANVSVRSSVANDTAGFAIYRDGKLIGNHVNQTLGTVSAVTIVQLTVMDLPPPGNRTYALYWSPGTGTLVANSNQRNLYALNLVPQG
jgi:hypothetical protein